MTRCGAAIVCGVAVLVGSTGAAADPVLTFAHLHSPREACLAASDPPDCVSLPAGYFLDEPTYLHLDAEMKRLQDQETRLSTENESLRKTAASWQPGWITLTTALVVGLAAGVYLDRKL